MPTSIAVKLNRLECVVENEHGSEPYLWPILVADEGGEQHLAAPTPEYAAVPLANELTAGQSIAFPSGMDSTLTALLGDRSAGLIVLVVALFEKDSSLRKGSIAVLRHVEQQALRFVRDHAAACRQSSGDRGDLRNQLVAQLNLASAETGVLSYYERYQIEFSPGSWDDSVGFALWTFSGTALVNRNLSIPLNSSTEQYTLTAVLQTATVLPDRCALERQAVAQAKARVDGLQHMRTSLQTMLHHATPQQKPAIVRQIVHINEVDLPAAEAALAQAEAALESCRSRFDTHGPIDSPIVNG